MYNIFYSPRYLQSLYLPTRNEIYFTNLVTTKRPTYSLNLQLCNKRVSTYFFHLPTTYLLSNIYFLHFHNYFCPSLYSTVISGFPATFLFTLPSTSLNIYLAACLPTCLPTCLSCRATLPLRDITLIPGHQEDTLWPRGKRNPITGHAFSAPLQAR